MGLAALVGGGLAWTAGGAALTTGTALAVGGGAVALAHTKFTTKQRLAEKEREALKYKMNYYKCKGGRTAKGKLSYPEDSSTSIFSSNCHSPYKKWKEAEAKRGQLAASYETKLAITGKLDEEAKKALVRRQEIGRQAVMLPDDRDKYLKKKGRKRDDRLRKKLGITPLTAVEELEIADAAMAEVDDEALLWNYVLGGGVVGVAGLAIWYFALRKTPASPIATHL